MSMAHELSHIANRDIPIGSVSTAMDITVAGRMVMFGAMFGGMQPRPRSAGNPIGMLNDGPLGF